MSVDNEEKVFCVVFIDIVIVIVIYNPWLACLIPEQCSPYQAVTGKNLPPEGTLLTACNLLKVC